MLKKAVAAMVLVALVTSISGCARMYTTDNFNGLDLTAEGRQGTHYLARNAGFYFLWIPLLSGNPEKYDSLINTTLMNDTVNLDAMADLISTEATGDGYGALEDTGSGYSSWMIPFPIPFLFYWKSVSMSANGV